MFNLINQLFLRVGFILLVATAVSAWFTKDASFCFFWGAVLYLLVILNRRTDLIKQSINADVQIDASIPEILDKLIQECFDEWYALNEGYREIEFINKDKEKDILLKINELVAARMSRTFQSKLNSYYNEEAVDDVVAKKVYMLVMNYVITNNIPKDKPKLPNYSANGDMTEI